MRNPRKAPPPPLKTAPTLPNPTGRSGSAGFYATAEYVMLTQNRAIGEQTIAFGNQATGQVALDVARPLDQRSSRYEQLTDAPGRDDYGRQVV